VETGIVIAIVAVLKGTLLAMLAWMRAQLRSMASRIVYLEEEVERCHEDRLKEQRQLGQLEAQVQGLRQVVLRDAHADRH
jgi:hypothetical protein